MRNTSLPGVAVTGLRPTQRQNSRWKPRWVLIAALLFLVLGALDAALLATHWPFTRRAVIESLEKASSARVEIGRFHSVFFPQPGCVAENVIIYHPGDSSSPPLITISRMTAQGDYSRL